MRIALVHDYIGEFGGAERVLLALSEIYPDAPIYTAFVREGSFLEKLNGKTIKTSWVNKVPFFAEFLHSPLRFLTPLIWGSFDFSQYDLVITSASWYVTKGIRKGPKTIEICYCHTPPRYLYGYETSVKQNWLIRTYSIIVNPFMRYYDFVSAQKVDYFIANSKNVQDRIKKFYRRDSEVIYPPVEVPTAKVTKPTRDYYFIVARIVGAKGIEMAVEAANRLKVPLKIAGEPAGFSTTFEELKENAGSNVEFLGFVTDEELGKLYANAKAFLALSRDEDFGMTLPEAMQAGTPVIAYQGGGYLETVIDGKTGTFFEDYDVESLIAAIKRLDKMKITSQDCKRQGEKFSKKVFQEKIKEFVEKNARVA